VGSNSEIQGYNLYPMLHFCRKFSSGITMGQGNWEDVLCVTIKGRTVLFMTSFDYI